MGFFDKLKKGLNKTRENLTNKIENWCWAMRI